MLPICSMCGDVILRDLKDYEGDPLHSRCHRDYITSIFDGMVEVLPSILRRYFTLTGDDRADFREYLRGFLADYRTLSY